MNERMQPVSQALDPQLKKKNPRQMTKPQKMEFGTKFPLLQESGKGRLRWQTSSPATKGYTQTKITETTG